MRTIASVTVVAISTSPCSRSTRPSTDTRLASSSTSRMRTRSDSRTCDISPCIIDQRPPISAGCKAVSRPSYPSGVMALPDWLVPMAATLTQERFTGPEWIFERKHDGIRLLTYKDGADVRMYSRNRLPQDLPAIGDAVARLPVHDAILDGELTWDE